MAGHVAHCQVVIRETVKQKEEAQQQLSAHLTKELPVPQRRTLYHIVKGGASGWLTVLPLREEGYNLSATQFRDQLAICYHCEPTGLPA